MCGGGGGGGWGGGGEPLRLQPPGPEPLRRRGEFRRAARREDIGERPLARTALLPPRRRVLPSRPVPQALGCQLSHFYHHCYYFYFCYLFIFTFFPFFFFFYLFPPTFFSVSKAVFVIFLPLRGERWEAKGKSRRGREGEGGGETARERRVSVWEGGDAAPPARPRTMYQDYPGNFDTSSRGSSGSPGHPETYSSGAAQQVGPGAAPLRRSLRGLLRALRDGSSPPRPGSGRRFLPSAVEARVPGREAPAAGSRRCRGSGLPQPPLRPAALSGAPPLCFSFLPFRPCPPAPERVPRRVRRDADRSSPPVGAVGGTACPERGRAGGSAGRAVSASPAPGAAGPAGVGAEPRLSPGLPPQSKGSSGRLLCEVGNANTGAHRTLPPSCFCSRRELLAVHVQRACPGGARGSPAALWAASLGLWEVPPELFTELLQPPWSTEGWLEVGSGSFQRLRWCARFFPAQL